MTRIAAVGDPVRVRGWGLAGVLVVPVTTAAQARHAWDALPDEVALVVTTPEVAEAVGPAPGARLVAVMPG